MERARDRSGHGRRHRGIGEQVKHVACANVGFFNQIEGKTPPDACGTGGPNPARTKAELVAYLKESYAYARFARLNGVTPPASAR
jgi:hypothetical protein